MKRKPTSRLHIYEGTIEKYPELTAWLESLPSRGKTNAVITVLLTHIRREKKKHKE